MTEKNIFAYYKFFLSLNISDFNLFILFFLLHSPPLLSEKIYLLFPSNPLWKFSCRQVLSSFENLIN